MIGTERNMGAALPDFPKASYEAGTYALGNGAFAYLQPDGGWGLLQLRGS
jgi:hypothetical protein